MLVTILVKTVGSVVNELCTLGILHLERWQNIFQEVTGLINRPLQFISSFSRRESVAVLKKSAILSCLWKYPSPTMESGLGMSVCFLLNPSGWTKWRCALNCHQIQFFVMLEAHRTLALGVQKATICRALLETAYSPDPLAAVTAHWLMKGIGASFIASILIMVAGKVQPCGIIY
jgi:hypothetical protein